MPHMPVTQDRFARAVQLRNAAQGKKLRRLGRDYTLHSIMNDGLVVLDPIDQATPGDLTGQLIADPSELEIVKA